MIPPTTQRPRLIGVGVGPRDPELVTIKAVNALRRATVVLGPDTEGSGDGPGRAETIVVQTCPDAARAIQRKSFLDGGPLWRQQTTQAGMA